jgi:hypothetical protein
VPVFVPFIIARGLIFKGKLAPAEIFVPTEIFMPTQLVAPGSVGAYAPRRRELMPTLELAPTRVKKTPLRRCSAVASHGPQEQNIIIFFNIARVFRKICFRNQSHCPIFFKYARCHV